MQRVSRRIKRNVTAITPRTGSLQYDGPELCKKNRGIQLNGSSQKRRPISVQEKAWRQLLNGNTEKRALQLDSECEISLVREEGFDPYNNCNSKNLKTNLR